ncbi:MAG: hypothetical protein HRU19_13685 [Pseudobacteriovorax sp.]|nr:hypothetical protein [Pseudobacteriovorax sp.]
MKLLNIFVLILATISCKQKQNKDTSQPVEFFIHGDPLELVENTDQNRTSPFQENNLPSFASFALSGFIEIKQKSVVSAENRINGQAELEKANSSSGRTRFIEAPQYAFAKATETTYHYRASNVTGYPTLSFVKDSKGHLNLKTIASTQTSPVEPLHYSVSEDGFTFSILFTSEDSQGKKLTAMFFTKNFDQNHRRMKRTTSENFAFFLGRDKAIGWRQPLEVSICGKEALAQERDVREAINSWATSEGKISGLDYSIAVDETPRPFSDINQKCIQMIDQYRMEDQENLAELGSALVIINQFSQEIVSSHSFIFLAAHKRSFVKTSLVSTITHEFGHMLGLGHEFSRDPETNESLYDSIMGYSGIDQVKQRDREAIAALYPTANNTNPLTFINE